VLSVQQESILAVGFFIFPTCSWPSFSKASERFVLLASSAGQYSHLISEPLRITVLNCVLFCSPQTPINPRRITLLPFLFFCSVSFVPLSALNRFFSCTKPVNETSEIQFSAEKMSFKTKFPEKDPYDVLGVPFGATDTEITKAYRKLALTLHPDKQSNLSPAQAEDIAKRFHDVKEARAFLLEVEHAEDRRQFDAKRESERLRREADALREQTMSARRKQMRDELQAKEAAAKLVRKRTSVKRKQQQDDDLVEQLRREGKRKRTEFAERDAAAHQEKELQEELQRRQDQKDRQAALEERQVRLKWDRKKVKPSPSEDSLAKLFSEKFGAVEHVELLGKKGNQALVTFEDSSSCPPCVEFYADSKEMRAKFVGKRKDEEEEQMEQEEEQDQESEMERHKQKSHRSSGESLESRRLRQAEERERLLREMEEEEENENVGGKVPDEKKKKSTKASMGRKSKFPLPLPESEKYQNLSPLDILENFEDGVLRNLISPDKLQSIKVPHV
jgi:DnaJ homolog subfamily C member 17